MQAGGEEGGTRRGLSALGPRIALQNTTSVLLREAQLTHSLRPLGAEHQKPPETMEANMTCLAVGGSWGQLVTGCLLGSWGQLAAVGRRDEQSSSNRECHLEQGVLP